MTTFKIFTVWTNYGTSHTDILHLNRTLCIAAQRHPNESIHVDICMSCGNGISTACFCGNRM